MATVSGKVGSHPASLLLISAFASALVAASPAIAQEKTPPAPQQKKLPEPPEKLPRVGADRTRGLDFLFGALKAAPDEASAKHVEGRIWALWTQTQSDTAMLLMTRAKTAIRHDHAGIGRRQAGARCVPQGARDQPASRQDTRHGEEPD
jgi:hypothetical protein